MSQFQKGQKVRLKSGGPVMTISNTGNFSMGSGIEDGALCVWFDDKNDVKEKVFDVSVLEEAADKGSFTPQRGGR